MRKIDNRKPWMKQLKNMRFSLDGLMTQETDRAQTSASYRESTCIKLSKKYVDYTPQDLNRILNSESGHGVC